MSKITLSGNASGTGTFTIASPNSNSDRTVNLPDAGGDMVLTTATQTLTNKTIQNSPIQGGAITQATAVASTSGTSIDFTGIPSWVKRITVMLSGVSTSGTSSYLIQLGDSGGFETTGYLSTLGAMANAAGSTQGLQSTAGFLTATLSNAADTVQGSTIFTNLSGNIWVSQGVIYRSSGVIINTDMVVGTKTLSDTLTQVRITTVNGTDTFDAGTINIMYEG